MNFISRIIKSINAMRERLKIERHEAMYGPHFNEECALKAVSKMENEDGSRGEHWSLEETTSIANQYGINLKGEKYNKYDWYVALNMFNPFFNPYRVRRIDQGGIPTLDTIFSNVDTTNNTVTYGICPFQWRQLPCRGLILLNINHTATGATEGSLVSVATSVSSSQVSSNPTSVNTNSGKALLNGSGDQMPTEEISTGNKYLIYYDKRTGVFQTINHIVAPAA